MQNQLPVGFRDICKGKGEKVRKKYCFYNFSSKNLHKSIKSITFASSNNKNNKQ